MKAKELLEMLLVAFLAVVGLGSCSNCDDDGDWDPMKWKTDVKMDKQHSIAVPAEGGTYRFICRNYNSFWIAGLQEEGKYIVMDYDFDDYSHAHGEWLEAGVEKNVLTVTVPPNTKENSRTGVVEVTAGDIFDHFIFNQAGTK